MGRLHKKEGCVHVRYYIQRPYGHFEIALGRAKWPVNQLQELLFFDEISDILYCYGPSQRIPPPRWADVDRGRRELENW